VKKISVNTLQNIGINKLIDENIRFTITHDEEEDIEEEDKINNVSDKITLLREQCLRGNL
jgi:hypothetical protein